METGSALDYVIRSCVYLDGAEGAAAHVLKEAYGRGLLGLGENRRQHELYAEDRSRAAGPAEARAVARLLELRHEAFELGRRDAAILHSDQYK